MGGRGTGSTILNAHSPGVGIKEDDSASWRNVVADFNPNAGHREVHDWQTLLDFAEVAKKSKDSVEFLGVMDDQGYMIKVSQGKDGECSFTPEMRKDMVGHNITHYHNRREATPQQIQETEESIKEWSSLARAFRRHETAQKRIQDADKRFRAATNAIIKRGGDPNAKNPPANLQSYYDERNDAWREMQLGNRQRVRAEEDFRNRYKAYTNKEAPTKAAQFSIPSMKNVTIDETGFIGGCFSPQDIDSSLLAMDIPSFSASGDEGTYTIALKSNTTDKDLFTAKWQVRQLLAKRPATDEAKEFQKGIKRIDRATANEGRKKGWSKQQTIAVSMNRQLSYLWSVEKEIFANNNIAATYTANPNFKPKWEY